MIFQNFLNIYNGGNVGNTHDISVNKMQQTKGIIHLGLYRYNHWRNVTNKICPDFSKYHGTWDFTFLILKLCIHGLKRKKFKCPGHSGPDSRTGNKENITDYFLNISLDRIANVYHFFIGMIHKCINFYHILCFLGDFLNLIVLLCRYCEHFWLSPDSLYDFLLSFYSFGILLLHWSISYLVFPHWHWRLNLWDYASLFQVHLK